LRHTMASRLLASGSSLKEVADVLRHRSLNTTLIYVKLDSRIATRSGQVMQCFRRRIAVIAVYDQCVLAVVIRPANSGRSMSGITSFRSSE
jgi:Phage integrase family